MNNIVWWIMGIIAIGYISAISGVGKNVSNIVPSSTQVINQVDNNLTPIPKQNWTVEQQDTFSNGCLQGGDSQRLCACTLQYFQAKYSPDEYIQELEGAQNASVWASAKTYCNSSNQQTQRPTPNNSSTAGGDETYQNDMVTSRDYQFQDINLQPPTSTPIPTSTPTINVHGGASVYQQIGDTAFGSDGSTYQRIGNAVFGNDGSIYQQIGDTTIGNNGDTYQQIGNTTFGNHGDTYQQIGNTSFGSDGSICQQIGSSTFCNGGN